MQECYCDGPGFCQFFNKEMTANPPNWQWCQSASPEEREKYKVASDKGMAIKNERSPNCSGNIVSCKDLVNDAVEILLPKIIKDHEISAVVGVPRSGMIPAATIAAAISVPLLSMSDNQIIVLNSFSTNGGYRMQYHDPVVGKILFIDDTVYGGNATRKIKEKFPRAIFGSVYALSENKNVPDYYGKELEKPHILEWNFFNSSYITESILDIDGILNQNIPINICIDEQKYIDYIQKVEPIFTRIPKLFSAKALVTGRLEKYRDITEQWLKKHSVKYKELIMFPTELENERNKNHVYEVGRYKAGVMKNIGAKFFVESELSEAKIIRKHCSTGIVVCPNHGVYF